jgi:hypothetical protein
MQIVYFMVVGLNWVFRYAETNLRFVGRKLILRGKVSCISLFPILVVYEKQWNILYVSHKILDEQVMF